MSFAAGAVLYTRRVCPLCFALRRLARRASRRYRVEFSEVDVDLDPELRGRYGERVPVLELPGGAVIAGRASATEIDEAFRRAAAFLERLESPPRPGGAGLPRRTPRSPVDRIRRVLGLASRHTKDGPA